MLTVWSRQGQYTCSKKLLLHACKGAWHTQFLSAVKKQGWCHIIHKNMASGGRLGNDGRRWQCKVFCRDLHFQIHLSFGRGRDGLLLHTFHTHVLALSFDLSKCHAYMCMGSRRNRKARGAHLYLCTVSKGGRQTNERCEKFLLVVGFYFFFLLTARNDAFEHVAKYDGRDELFTQGNAVKG